MQPPPSAPSSPARGLAVVDVEASGRSPWRHRVVEIGVVLLDYPLLRVEAEFSTLIDPGGPVGPTDVHRIAQEQVVGAPTFREIAPHLAALLRGRVLVGHHVRCDEGFLAREFARFGVQLPVMPTLCTMALAERVLGGRLTGRGLGACVEAFGLPEFDAHTALGDARAAARLLRSALATPAGGVEPLRALVESAQHTCWPKLRQRAGAVPTKNRSGTVFPASSLSSAYAVPCAVPYGVPVLVPAGVEEIA
ncbi:3'-5' exonuclease [Streptacidiphilus rugosus]|uniref:3'-5' exonuclease n=1 Tax=Streptacidiphilus rugosus TaxID=405783 RepID=UPI00068AEEC2|nr:3'-5' exonuclease [Streptacidiphilus rugosus]